MDQVATRRLAPIALLSGLVACAATRSEAPPASVPDTSALAADVAAGVRAREASAPEAGQRALAERTLELEEARRLLAALERQTLSTTASVEPPYALTLFEPRHAEPLVALLERRHANIRSLGGVLFAAAANSTDPPAFETQLLELLDDRDPRWRALACDTLAYLNDVDPVPALRLKLSDSDVVEGFHGQPTVAVFAAHALAVRGYADGVGFLIDQAERGESESIGSSYTLLFERFSGEDFGTDWEAWRRWFRAHPEALSGNPLR